MVKVHLSHTNFSLNISEQAEIDSSSLVRLNISASRNTILPGKLMENIVFLYEAEYSYFFVNLYLC